MGSLSLLLQIFPTQELNWNLLHCRQIPYQLIYQESHVYVLVTQTVKTLPAMRETWVWSLGQEDPLEKGMATHSSILAWEIPWTEGPGGLQSMGSQRVGDDWATNSFTFIVMYILLCCCSVTHMINGIHYVSGIYTTIIFVHLILN